MEISASPQNLIQILLDEFKKGMVDFLNLEIDNLPIKVKKDIINNLIIINAGCDSGKPCISNESDIYKILRILWTHWDDCKEKVFTVNESNGFGQTYRSYLRIIMQARNEWAHQNA